MENKTNFEYTYRFATGTETIEVSDYWAGVLADLDREEYNIDRKPFRDRRRCGIEFGEIEGKMIADPFNLEETVLERRWLEYLRGKLTDKQCDVFMALIKHDGSMEEACKELGMNRSTLQCHRSLIQNRLYDDLNKKKGIDNVKTGINIRNLRRSAELSVNLMADMIGVSRRQYFRIEKGESGLTEEMAAKIASFFMIPVNEFFEYKI